MTGQYEVYRKEVYDFLRTCTIKFSPFTYIYGRSQILTYGYTDINQAWNPYYQNLCGEYQDYDTPMYIYCKETDSDILFDKNLVTTHPVLASYYRIPNKEFDLLCKKYPSQVGLIKSIVYPVADIQTIYDAPELTLLAYDSSLLYAGEREQLIQTLNKFLGYVRERWWCPDFNYEDLYIHAFWYMLWQALPNVLLTQRMCNLGTAYVHPFHVWEYLISKGLGDYRDVLTTKQALWLYRNLKWVLKNKGKQMTLEALTKNILGDVAVSLYGKDLLQQTADQASECMLVPEVVSVELSKTALENDNTSMAQFGVRLYQAGLDTRMDNTYLTETTTELGRSIATRLPTKYLEFRRNNINTRWEHVLVNFLVESTVYRYLRNQVKYTISLTDAPTSTKVALSFSDALALLYYVLTRQYGDTLEKLPTQFCTYICYRADYPQALAKTFTYKGRVYRFDQWLDVDSVLKDIPFDNSVYTDQLAFQTFIDKQFITYLRDARLSMSIDHDIRLYAFMQLYHQLRVKQTHTLHLSDNADYSDWWINHPELQNILTYYEENTDQYSTLADNLIKAMFPISTTMSELIGISEYNTRLLTALKSLFTQVSSYNVTFLDATAIPALYLQVGQLVSHLEQWDFTSSLAMWSADLWPIYKSYHSVDVGTDIGFGIGIIGSTNSSTLLTDTVAVNMPQIIQGQVTRYHPIDLTITISRITE